MNKMNINMAVNNTIRILGFIGLAIFFDKWWLSLFSAFFLLSFDKEKNDR